MQKIEYIEAGNVNGVNKLLEDGWNVKQLIPVTGAVASGGVAITGAIRAYVILEK